MEWPPNSPLLSALRRALEMTMQKIEEKESQTPNASSASQGVMTETETQSPVGLGNFAEDKKKLQILLDVGNTKYSHMYPHDRLCQDLTPLHFLTLHRVVNEVLIIPPLLWDSTDGESYLHDVQSKIQTILQRQQHNPPTIVDT